MTQTSCAGVWDTDFGRLELKVAGNRVTGTYGPNGGRLEGMLTGVGVVGTWRQAAPSTGGETWGTFNLKFSADGRSFTCRWEYQDSLAPGWGNWYGRRETNTFLRNVLAALTTKASSATSPSRPTATPRGPKPHPTAGMPPSARERVASKFEGKWDTDHGVLEMRVVGQRVTGTYGTNDGTLEGVISGNCVIGTWRQKSPCACGMTWGTLTLTLSGDGKTITGVWQYQDELAPGCGNWYGSRA